MVKRFLLTSTSPLYEKSAVLAQAMLIAIFGLWSYTSSVIAVDSAEEPSVEHTLTDSCTWGKNVDREFWRDVLKRLDGYENINIYESESAIDALERWKPFEGSKACWNPLATTWNTDPNEHTSTWDLFNSHSVKSYKERRYGVQATAATLSLHNTKIDASPIRNMLAGQNFDRDGLFAALDTWTSQGCYASSLIDEWQNVYGYTGSETSNYWRGKYWNNRYLSKDPILCRQDNNINFDWGEDGSPGDRINAYNFSARWTRRVYLDAGTYKFTVRADDGIRVWLDDNRIINEWRNQAPTTYEATRTVESGEHDIKIQYYEKWGGAVAEFRWEEVSSNANLAHDGYVYATSVEQDDWSRYAPSNLTDGSTSTRWSSKQASEGGSDFEYFWVNLGDWYDVNEVVLYWENAYATRYQIYVWDGYWKRVNTTSYGNGGIDTGTFSSQTTCCVAMVGREKYNSSWGYSLWEFEVYGSPSVSAAGLDILDVDPALLSEELNSMINQEQKIFLPLIQK